MLSYEAATNIVRALDGVSEREHFESESFIANKRIFATFWRSRNEVNLRLSLEDQAEFLELAHAFREIPNSWGKKGWTTVSLEFVDRKSFLAALQAAWRRSAVKAG